MDDLTLDSICGVRLYQRMNGYRFSIDSVLLAGYAKLSRRVRKVADIGAGSGVVGLVLAARYSWIRVLLIEIQRELSALSGRNIVLNRLEERVQVLEADVSAVTSNGHPDLMEGFDAVVSNPPFRRPGTGKVSPFDERAVARHEIKLTLADLMRASSALLKTRGRLFMVYHPFRLSEVVHTMKEFLLEPKRMRFVLLRGDHGAHRGRQGRWRGVEGGKASLYLREERFVHRGGGLVLCRLGGPSTSLVMLKCGQVTFQNRCGRGVYKRKKRWVLWILKPATKGLSRGRAVM
ncbi:MAG: methyltransferase [Nitrospirae bacterium]|nr:methyltransferase [Nitrospirota bacterium]